MALAKGKCPNCGEFIEVEENDFNVICRFCGVPFLPKEAIEKYQNYLSNLGNDLNIDTINVNADNISNYATLGLTALKEKNPEKCGFYADDILKRQPLSPEGLLLKAYFICDNYSKEEGLRYYFLSYANAKDGSLKKLIVTTLKEDLINFSIENIQYFFDEINKVEDQDFKKDIIEYVLTLISSELDTASIISGLNFVINNIEELLTKKREVIWNEEEYEISLINDNLIYCKNNEVRLVINLNLIDKKVEKYKNKNTKAHQYTYYFYLGERIISLNMKNENALLEELINKYSLTLESIHSGCYVATCVYGSYNTSEVWVLRRFRDSYLRKSLLGRMFIKVYYFISPIIIKFFGENKLFRKINHKLLNSLVHKLINKGYSSSPYRDN